MSPGLAIVQSLKWMLAGTLCFAALILMPGSILHASGPDDRLVALETAKFYRNLGRDVRYYEDKVKGLTPKEALQLNVERDYRPIPGNLVDFGFTRSAFWLRVPVRNASDQTGKWVLSLDVPNIEQMAVYLRPKGKLGQAGLRRIFSTDESHTFSGRRLPHRNLATEFELPSGQQAELLIRYSFKQATQLPLFIESPDHYFARVASEDTHNWSLFALLIGMTLVSTIFLTALGFGTAGFYGAYILASAFYLFHTDGYAFQYLWPNAPWWNSVAIVPIGMVMVITGSLFARAFTRAPQFHPILNKVMLSNVGIAGFVLLVSFIGLQYQAFKTVTLLFVVWAALLYLLAGALAARRGQAGSAFFLCGAVAVISSIVFGAVGYLNPGSFNQDIAGHYGRFALLIEGIAFALAILLHILSLRRERDVALRREIATTQEKLALSEALVSAERDHSRAMALAETRRERLASTAHDLQQPLSSLRMAVSRLGKRDDGAAKQVRASFDYLDRLVRAGLEESNPDDDDHHHAINTPTNGDGRERFPVAVVLQNVAAMFRDEAALKGIDLRLVNSQIKVEAQPLVLMRIVANLVSNAVKHTRRGKVVFGCRRRDGRLCIEVHDTGPGMSAGEVERLLQPYERASDAPGTGLGLSLVKDLTAASGYGFEINSKPGAGTCAMVCLTTWFA